jgi:hypothetical protein
MSKLNKILLLSVGVLIIGSLFLGVKSLLFGDSENSGYSAVYMVSGDIYFGKLQRFPKLMLADAYTLQRNQDAQTPFTLVKFKDAFWGPVGNMSLNEDNVLWIAELDKNSPIGKNIESQQAP